MRKTERAPTATNSLELREANVCFWPRLCKKEISRKLVVNTIHIAGGNRWKWAPRIQLLPLKPDSGALAHSNQIQQRFYTASANSGHSIFSMCERTAARLWLI